MQPVVDRLNRESVKAKLETVFERLADALLDETGHMSIILKTRRTKRPTQSSLAPVDRFQSQDPVLTRRVTFPGKTAEEAWRFTVVVRILELIHGGLRNDVVLSKRDIFYRDPALFGSQIHVDRYVEDIALTFSVPRAGLNITAVSKGLIAGAVTFCRRDGPVFSASIDTEGIPVPNVKEVLSVDLTLVSWIVVIEKEATFRSIASSEYWETASSNGVIVTAKGYPDVATRAMLNFLGTPSPRNGFATPPIFGFVDFDPDGLSILSTYKYGSAALSSQTAQLCVPHMQWLGLRSEHACLSAASPQATQGRLTLSARDRRRGINMLWRDQLAQENHVRQELQRMLMLNIKAELQLLDDVPNGMCDFLAVHLTQTGDLV